MLSLHFYSFTGRHIGIIRVTLAFAAYVCFSLSLAQCYKTGASVDRGVKNRCIYIWVAVFAYGWQGLGYGQSYQSLGHVQ